LHSKISAATFIATPISEAKEEALSACLSSGLLETPPEFQKPFLEITKFFDQRVYRYCGGEQNFVITRIKSK
jgi:hypothetical protein